MIESMEASNRIEGIVTERARYPRLLEEVRSQSRAEDEILGYKMALEWIHKRHREIDIEITTIRKLHRLCMGSDLKALKFLNPPEDSGAFKEKDNGAVLFDIINIG
jgi:hypothetical protein